MAIPDITFRERGFPYGTFPSGWFQVAWSAELEPGGVMPLHYFGTELVLFRTMAGRAVITDATCPHLGAHLGYGGKVNGECLQCPYHGWVWNSDGSLADVPYSARKPKARIRTWPAREVSGILYLWHDHLGAEPTWEPPAVAEEADEGFHRSYPHGAMRERLYTHPQFATENFPDIVHMKYVHGWIDVPTPDIVQYDGPVARNEYDGRVPTPRGEVKVRTEGYAYGLGLNIARITGAVQSCTLGAFTPIDDRSSMGFASVWVPKGAPDEEKPNGLGSAMIRANHEQLFGSEHDRPIFEHVSYRTKPMLMPEELTLHRDFRRWAKQFYPAETAAE